MDKTITFTNDELSALWCLAYENKNMWSKYFLASKSKDDLFMYHVARTAYAKLHRQLDNAIIPVIRVSHKKYIWKGGN